MASLWLFLLTVSLCLFTSSSAPHYRYYTQALNHIGVGGLLENVTFLQRFVVDDQYWSSQKSGPLLVYFGGEGPISQSIGNIGVINEAAPRLRALVVYIEHRFFGTSIPYGSIDTALLSPVVRSYLSTENALADFAEIILDLKANLSATSSPVIVIGGSYAGMLAAWFRMKYPHVALGALASSAPVFFFEDIPVEDDYCSIITRDFEQVDQVCANVIRQSWKMIDKIAVRPHGLGTLSKIFNTCRALLSVNELKEMLIEMYSFVAQYNGAHNDGIESVCDPIVNASEHNTISLEGVARALFILSLDNNSSCIKLGAAGGTSVFDVLDKNSLKAWNWLTCSEIVSIRSCNGVNPILPPEFFPNKSQYMQDCWNTYYTWPHAEWIRTYYGGRDIKYASNIIFSNGLMDPYSRLGVLDDISSTLVAVTTREGSHCLDLDRSAKNDPRWLKNQRAREIQIFERWISGGPKVRKVVRKATPMILMVAFLVLNF